MGNSVSNLTTTNSNNAISPSSSVDTTNNNIINANSKLKPMRERLRYGVCCVKIAPIANGQRRPSDRMTSYFVTPRGSLIHGTSCNPQLIQRGMTKIIELIIIS